MDLSTKRQRTISTRSTAEKKFKQQRHDFVPPSEPDNFIGKGTSDNPLSIDDSDDDDNDISIDNGNGSNDIGKNNDEDNDDDIQEQIIKTIVDPNNIYLSPKQVCIGQFQTYPTEELLLFKETQMEIIVPWYFLAPSSKIIKDCQISLPYKHLKEFIISGYKNFINIDILISEFYFKKTWLVKPVQNKNFEIGITNTISFKSIPREQFDAMNPFIEKKSTNLKLSMEFEDHNKMEKVIAHYPHTNSTKEVINHNDIVKITYQDKCRLEPNQYLNDSIIDFYIRYIKDHFVQKEDKDRFYFFNTFFYNILTQQSSIETAFSRISKWTKNVDIFSYDFLFIPICENSHWTLLIVSFPYQEFEKSTNSCKPLIIFLDSLNSQKLNNINKKIREYLTLEWQARKVIPSNGKVAERKFTGANLKLVRANVPRQDNLFDCGVFLLQYIELFCRNPEKDFENPLNRPNWFKIEDIIAKREILKVIIEKLEIEQELDESEDDTTKTKKTLTTTTTTTDTTITNIVTTITTTKSENEMVEIDDDEKQNNTIQPNNEKMHIDEKENDNIGKENEKVEKENKKDENKNDVKKESEKVEKENKKDENKNDVKKESEKVERENEKENVENGKDENKDAYNKETKDVSNIEEVTDKKDEKEKETHIEKDENKPPLNNNENREKENIDLKAETCTEKIEKMEIQSNEIKESVLSTPTIKQPQQLQNENVI